MFDQMTERDKMSNSKRLKKKETNFKCQVQTITIQIFLFLESIVEEEFETIHAEM